MDLYPLLATIVKPSENVKIALHARIHGTDATFPAQGQAHGRNGTSAQGHEGEKAPKTFTDEERTIAMEDTNSSAGASSSADGTSQAGGSTQPLDSRPKRPSWETEVADEKEGAFVIVSNVQGEFEEACILVVKRRKQSPDKLSVLGAVPILKDFKITMSQLPSMTPESALEGLLSQNTPSKSSGMRFTIASGREVATGTTEDSQGLQDFLTVLRELAALAEKYSFEPGSTHKWMASYVDRLPSGTIAPIFSRFSSSAFAPPPRPRAPSPGANELKVSIGTWNVNGQMPTQQLARWLHAEDDPDIFVLGFQELDLSSQAYLYYSPQREDSWSVAFEDGLGRRAGEYVKLASRQLVGVLIMIFVRRDLEPSISELTTSSVGVGLGGFIANKGATAIRFRVGDASLCFVTSHLSAFDGPAAVQRRNWDYAEIVRRLVFALPDPERVQRTDADKMSTDSSGSDDTIEVGIMDHDLVFWLGDLNYRIDLGISEIKRLVRKKQFALLLKYDQLVTAKRDKHAFEEFQEGEINFPPTYKYDRGTDDFDTSEKQRSPAWTDRIQWSERTRPGWIRLVSYGSCMELNISDHKPVLAVFLVKIR